MGLALRQKNLPSEWLNEPPEVLITALRLLEESDQASEQEQEG